MQPNIKLKMTKNGVSPDKEIVFSTESLNKVQEIVARYPEGKQKSALITG